MLWPWRTPGPSARSAAAAAIVATRLWTIGPFSIDLYLRLGLGALAIVVIAVVAWLDRGRSRACEVRPGTCADMTVC